MSQDEGYNLNNEVIISFFDDLLKEFNERKSSKGGAAEGADFAEEVGPTAAGDNEYAECCRLWRESQHSQRKVPLKDRDVVESTPDLRQVTNGCSVANLKLNVPDGKEAKASPSTSVISGVVNVSVADLNQLKQYIQEVLQREQILQRKLASLQQAMMSIGQAADLGWKTLLAEDMLFSRVEMLENQLQIYAKKFADDKLREELRKLQEDKSVYQRLAIKCLQKFLLEKLEAVQKCQGMERALTNAETECANLKKMMEKDHQELQELATKHNNELLKTAELQVNLELTEEQYKDALAWFEMEKEELQSEVNRLLANEAVMHKKIQQLEASGKMVGQQLLSQYQFKRSSDIHNLSSLKQQNGTTFDVICKNNDDEEDFKDEKQKGHSNVDAITNQLLMSVEKQKKAKEHVELIKARLPMLHDEKVAKLQQINAVRAEKEVHVGKLCKYKDEYRKLEQSETYLKERLKVLTSMLDSVIPLVDGAKVEKLSNGPHTPHEESLQTQINDLKGTVDSSTKPSETSTGSKKRCNEGETSLGGEQVSKKRKSTGSCFVTNNSSVNNERLPTQEVPTTSLPEF